MTHPCTSKLFCQLFCSLKITRITPVKSEYLMRLFIESKKGFYLINMYVSLNKKVPLNVFYAANLKSRLTQKQILGALFL